MADLIARSMAEEKRDKTVKITSTDVDFVERSNNLFNLYEEGNAVGYYLLNGALTAGAGYYTTHHIPCVSGKQYSIRYAETQFGAFYTAQGEFISKIGTVSGTSSPFTFTAPTGAYTMRVCGHKNKMSSDAIVEGASYPSSSSASSYYTRIQRPLLSSDNPLAGKRVLFNGDSITAGAGWPSTAILSPRNNTGWGIVIAERNGMSAAGYAVSGGTIAAGTFANNGTTPRHWICRDIVNMDENADFIILQGGINDYWLNVPIGAITTSYTAAFDDTTFCGALESIIKQAQLRWKGKKIGYIVTFKVKGTFDLLNQNKSELYWNKAREICEKWSVPFLDLFKTSGLNFGLSEIVNEYSQQNGGVGDGCHPTEGGYKEYLVPKIEAWMKTL
ncbi:SGNH/GDSL hydrolase family protein [Paenibacillus sp. GCM10012303]|uniref:SGNH/GDSL hydrolase family protein n=1 Tax=Paenibacillus sp. GCM10012303 TaxID=3317340 RepID=UPI0036079226